MRYWWPLTRPGRILAAVSFVSVAMTVGVVLAVRVSGSEQQRGIGTRPLHTPAAAVDRPPTTQYPDRPVAVRPAVTPEQSLIDSQLSQAEQPAVVPAGLLASLPAGAFSPGYKPVPDGDRSSASAFGTAFVTELVNRDYRSHSREGLLSWAQAESAPNTLPGVPADVAGHSLLLSLIDPIPAPGPVPAAGDWAGSTGAGEVQTVSNLQAVVDPAWLALTATGWQPADPAMTVLTVTGTVTTAGTAGTTTGSFSLHLTVGSSSYRPGYGAVAVDDWTVG